MEIKDAVSKKMEMRQVEVETTSYIFTFTEEELIALGALCGCVSGEHKGTLREITDKIYAKADTVYNKKGKSTFCWAYRNYVEGNVKAITGAFKGEKE